MKHAQKQVLDAIRAYINNNGYSPSIGELALTLNVYPNAVQEQIKRLERDGFITKKAGAARSLRLTEKAESL